MTLVNVLLVWCMYGDVTELEPGTLQAAASPPGSGMNYARPSVISSPHPFAASSEAETLERKRNGS